MAANNTDLPKEVSTPPWALLGRDTPAGKALYSLYNSENLNGRAAGMQYSWVNLQKIHKELAAKSPGGPAAGVLQQGPAKKADKPKVAVPHFRPKSTGQPVDKLAQVPRRRQAEQIKAAMEQEREQAWRQAPQPTGPLLDDQEKQRCALLMQYKGKVPLSETMALSNSSRSKQLDSGTALDSSSDIRSVEQSRLQTRRRALQQRFQEVMLEVEDREAFISRMQQLGNLKLEHLNVVKAEMAAKIDEMKQLDTEIKQLDKQLKLKADAADCCHDG